MSYQKKKIIAMTKKFNIKKKKNMTNIFGKNTLQALASMKPRSHIIRQLVLHEFPNSKYVFSI